MTSTGTITLLIIIANLIVSYKGFTDRVFFDRYKFRVDQVLLNKDYKRMFTSGFLHVSWAHLILNMVSLYAFSGNLELFLGPAKFLLIYFSSLLGGELLSLRIHRNEGDYSSVGASGAISGVVFACIALFPGMNIGFFLLPISIPGWLYGLAYILISIYAIRSHRGNIGHDAHLGGALVGLAVAILLEPSSIFTNYLPILAIALPTLFFIYVIIHRPHFLLIENDFFNAHNRNYTIDQRYNIEKKNRQQELDKILEKIHKKGMNSLSKKEKEMLDEYSRASK